jgi:hypothetical protein
MDVAPQDVKFFSELYSIFVLFLRISDKPPLNQDPNF